MAHSSKFIKEKFSQKLKSFPNASATIAIFGTQSTGKSTLMNHAFGTMFPILNTKEDRRRCTKGVWYQNVNNLNIIDTQGFDSAERGPEQKILQKQIALFCLALADVVVINMWMNEIGRYEGSHTNILQSIMQVSERLISSQEKKVIFVVKDCTQDADRSVMRQELQNRVNQVISQCQKKSKKSPKLNIEYYFMSHYFYKKQAYMKQARQLKQIIRVKKSHLSNYSPEDRGIYIKELWQKVTSAQNEVDLKSIEDALRGYVLERIKDETIEHCLELIRQVEDLQRYKSYQRLAEYIRKQAQKRFAHQKPAHIPQKQVGEYLDEIRQILEYSLWRQFSTVILPRQESKLLSQLQSYLSLQQKNRQLQKLSIRKRKQTTDLYKKLIFGCKESLSLVRKFTQKINEVVIKYQRQIAHLFNIFQTKLQKELNDQVDRQLARKNIYFDAKRIDEKIKKVCKEFEYNQWQINFKDMWQKISHRAISQKLPERIRQISKAYLNTTSIWTGDQTTNILAFHRKLQKQCEDFCSSIMNYFQEQTVVYQQFDRIKDQIVALMQKAIYQERARFHITLLIIAFFLYFFYGQFVYFLSMLPIKKKKRRYWVNLYIFSLSMIILIGVYNRRQSIRRFLGMN